LLVLVGWFAPLAAQISYTVNSLADLRAISTSVSNANITLAAGDY
jgi:hypothetical protein